MTEVLIAVVFLIIAALYGWLVTPSPPELEAREFFQSFAESMEQFNLVTEQAGAAFEALGNTMQRMVDDITATMTPTQRAVYDSAISRGTCIWDALALAKDSVTPPQSAACAGTRGH